MDLYYRQEVKVGLLVLAALAIVAGGAVWLSGRSFVGADTVTAEFERVSGLTKGDPVMIAGVTVGQVAGVRLQRASDGSRKVAVDLEVPKGERPRTDATVSVRALDFLGEKYVDYDPGRASEFLPEGRVITGVEQPDIASTAGELADRGGETLLRLQSFLSEDVAAQVQATLAAAERALDVIGRAGEGELMTAAEGTLLSLQSAASRLDSTLANPAIERSVSQLDELTANVNEMAAGLALATQTLAQIMQKVDSTDGTLGRVINDTTLHTDLHETLVALRNLLDDLRERPGRYLPGSIKVF